MFDDRWDKFNLLDSSLKWLVMWDALPVVGIIVLLQ